MKRSEKFQTKFVFAPGNSDKKNLPETIKGRTLSGIRLKRVI